jgi:hypothetical protein
MKYTRFLRTCIGSVLIILFAVAVGFFCLFLGYRITPNSNSNKSLEILESEGFYPSAMGQYNNLFYHQFDNNTDTLDDSTDSLIIRTASEMPSDNILRQMLSNMDYPRYWHGYILPLKVILHFMNYEEWRGVNFYLQLSLVICLCFLVFNRTKKFRYVLALLTSYFLLMPVALAESLQYSPVFYISFLGIGYVLIFGNRFRVNTFAYFFLILGILTSYFDLLTFPLLTYALPLLWYVVIAEDKKLNRLFADAASASVSWVMGYSIFWLLKWLIATPILGYNVVREAFHEIFYRAGEIDSTLQYNFYAFGRFDTIFINWHHYENFVYGAIILGWIAYGVYISFKCEIKTNLDKSGLIYFLIGFSGILWYSVLSNHTTIHHFFTYRIFNICISAFTLYLCSYELNVENNNAKSTNKILICVMWVSAFLIGIPISGIGNEKVERPNYAAPAKIELHDGDEISFDYTPCLSELKSFEFNISSPDGEGMVDLSILDSGETVYSTTIYLKDRVGAPFSQTWLDCDLIEGKTYTVEMLISEAEVVETYLSDAHLTEVFDFGNIQINGQKLETPIMYNITYVGRVKDKGRRLMLAIDVMGLLGTAVIGISRALQQKRNKCNEF